MIYKATRDKKEYVDRVWTMRNDGPRNVIAIGGGMSWLHHINGDVKKLTIVDKSNEQLTYISSVIAAIRHGNLNRLLLWVITEKSEKEHLFGFDRVSGEYNWLFGQYAFSSDDTYLELQEALMKMEIEYRTEALEDFPISNDMSLLPTYVLVGNADHNFYTKSDAILCRLQLALKGPVTYVGWRRTLKFIPGQYHEDCILKLRCYTAGRSVTEVTTFLKHKFKQEELEAKEHTVVSLPELTKNDYEVILAHLSWTEDEVAAGEPLKLIQHMVPDFHRFILLEWVSRFDVGAFMTAFTNAGLHRSLRVTVDWAGGETGFDRLVIVVLDLRGSIML